jgi:pyruvate/2-oxoglutarate dehydrogenase complex dihydrolipoamide acyltransferase (E2) component
VTVRKPDSRESPPSSNARESTRRRLPLVRRGMIETLMRAQAGMLPVTLSAEARVDGLLPAYAKLRSTSMPDLKMSAVLAKILVGVLVDHPALNARIVDDEFLVEYADVQLGVAIALDDGELLVAVVHRAQELALTELASRIADLIKRAHDRSLAPSDVRGGNFTLSNVGNVPSHGVSFVATPLIPPQQAGTIVTGRLRQAPVVEQDGRIVSAAVMPISMSFDHRVINGIPALTAFEEFIRRLNAPEQWL